MVAQGAAISTTDCGHQAHSSADHAHALRPHGIARNPCMHVCACCLSQQGGAWWQMSCSTARCASHALYKVQAQAHTMLHASHPSTARHASITLRHPQHPAPMLACASAC